MLSATWQLEDWQAIADGTAHVEFDDQARDLVKASRANLEAQIANGQPIYGVNTGFGSLCTTAIDDAELSNLQVNLLRSHACGMGELCADEVIRLMLVTKAKSLAKGFSGIRPVLIERLLDLYHQDILPCVPSMGSLGASGDLAPLSHLCLPLIGEGEVVVDGVRQSAEDAGLSSLALSAKEGLALINGTQFMLANGLYAALEARRVSFFADLCASLSLLAFEGSSAPFDARIHEVRQQSGQAMVAQRIREITKDAPEFKHATQHVQDPYSFRCVPQVHGASNDAWRHVLSILLQEAESVTDNPTVFEDAVISAGNFHGQPLALSLDFAKLATAEWGSISERRVNQMMLSKRGLPAFLADNPGLENGFMIAQYAAAAVVSRNKQRCTPASADSIDSSAGQEDHVSMGANAATDCLEILNNVWDILGIECMTAMRALRCRNRDAILNEFTLAMVALYEEAVKPAQGDTITSNEMAASSQFLKSLDIDFSLNFG